MKLLSTFGLLVFATGIVCYSGNSISQEYTEGNLKTIDQIVEQFSDVGVDSVAFETELFADIGDHLRVGFSDIVDNSASDYRIVFRDINNTVLDDVPRQDFAKRSSYWSKRFPGNYILIQVKMLNGVLPQGLKFNIKYLTREVRPPGVLSVIEPPEFEEMPQIEDARVVHAANSVARLSFIRDGESSSCTGFMIGNDALVTNFHCIASNEVCWTATVIFGAKYDSEWRKLEGEQFSCESVIGKSEKSDIAILKINGDPGKNNKWGQLKVSDSPIFDGEQLVVISYPSARTLSVNRKNCALVSAQVKNAIGETVDFSHICDTETGSSGAPVLDNNLEVVGIHHLGFELDSSDWKSLNRAINVRSLTEILGVQ